MAANASTNRCRVVSSMRLIASLVCAIESIRSLRWVVRNAWRVSSSSNCSIAIMLTGPSRSILRAARRWPLRRSASCALQPRCSADRDIPGSATARPSPGVLRLVGADEPAQSGVTLARSLRAPRLRRAPRRASPARVDAARGEMREVAFGGGPRDVELADRGAQRFERAARDADRRLRVRPPDAQRRRPHRRRWHVRAQRLERADVVVELRFAATIAVRRSLDALTRASRARAESAAARASSSSDRLFEPQHFGGTGRRRARPAPRARPGFGGAAAQILQWLRALRTGGAARRSGVRRPTAARLRAGRSRRALLPAAARGRRVLPRPGGARASAARASARRGPLSSAARCSLRLEADDRFSPGGGARRSAPRWRSIACAIIASKLGGFFGEPGQLLALGGDARRAARGSRAWSRGCRASPAGCRR